MRREALPPMLTAMSVVERLAEIGGVSTRRALVALTSRAQVDRALAVGDIVADSRGRYALPVADDALRAANSLHAVVSHTSAALHLGWEVKTAPTKPHLTLGRRRRLSVNQRRGLIIHRADLPPDDIAGYATSRTRTLLDCLRALPFDEALAVADSALRHDDVTEQDLATVARDAKGPGARSVRQVAALASGLAANPFESTLRAIAVQVPGLHVRPQVPIGDSDVLGIPDLVDEDLRIVLEADSFEWHGDRAALRRDARRYDEFVVAGWLVLRFSYEDVMGDPLWVAEMLRAAVRERTYQRCCGNCAA